MKKSTITIIILILLTNSIVLGMNGDFYFNPFENGKEVVPLESASSQSSELSKNVTTSSSLPLIMNMPDKPQEISQWYVSPSIQEINSSILYNQNVTENDGSFIFVNNIWMDELGTDSFDHSEFEEGYIDTKVSKTNETGSLNASLYTRIGNTGYGDQIGSTSNSHIANLSAGWRINFTVSENYDLINLSFYWMFDAVDWVFDDYRDTPELEILDPTPDYQEIRCKIIPPTGPLDSFWLGDLTTPNNTVFFRVGPEVIGDEEWYFSSYLFDVTESGTDDFILELGSYLNTREQNNEYFDVWFDNIMIQGLKNVTDDFLPVPFANGLQRSEIDKTLFHFWMNFSEGTWESQIENVTVSYNLTRGLNTTNLNAALVESQDYFITNAGYNHTHWKYSAIFDFNDSIFYKFIIFDRDNNSFTTPIYNATIEDRVAPQIASSTNPDDENFIRQSGDGTIEINLNITDWGDQVDQVIMNYTIDGEVQPLLAMVNITNYNESGLIKTLFGVNLTVNYGSVLSFTLFMNDTVGNYNYDQSNVFYKTAEYDIVHPVISSFNVYPDLQTEGKTHVEVVAHDPYGEIAGVFLLTRWENGTETNKSLKLDSTTLHYVPRTGDQMILLPYDNSEPSYTMTALVRDHAGLSTSNTSSYIVPDIVAPKFIANTFNMEYLTPGRYRVSVTIYDDGSGIDNVSLEIGRGDSWLSSELMEEGLQGVYYHDISTDVIGNQRITFRIIATDMVGNPSVDIFVDTTPVFITTIPGLLLIEIAVIILTSGLFIAVKVVQKRQLRTVRRHRFDLATRRSERLAYIGEEAMFGFIAAYGKGEGITSTLLWEPSMIGYFYQYLKELVDRANNSVDFVMQTRADDIITYVDFTIEEISCSAVVFAYPVAMLPQKWLSSLSLEQTPSSTSQGILMLMLLMREKWNEVSHSFQDEIRDGMHDIKNYILAEEDKETVLKQIQEFRLFISGTVEIMEEIETDDEDLTDIVMADFDLDSSEEDNES